MVDKLRLLDVVEAASSAAAAKLLYDKLKLITDDGGHAMELINDTGAATVKGTIVRSSTSIDNGFIVSPGDSVEPIGVVYDDGVKDGQPCRVVISGKAKVLAKDSTTATRGYWVQTSDVVGRADFTLAAPNPPTHFGELGHCLESKAGGTNVLVLMTVHFN